MSDNVRLDSASVEAVACRVAELLRGEDIRAELIDAAEAARRLGVSRDLIYSRADELGAVRLGDGKKARLRFDPAIIAERLAPTATQPEQLEHPKPRRRSRPPARADLLPIRGAAK